MGQPFPRYSKTIDLKRLLVLIPLFLFLNKGAFAQTYEELCDSLEAAVDMLKKFPDNNGLRLEKASWNLLLEQWEYAKKEYDIVLERDPKNVAALYYRAYAYEKMHRYKHAKKDYLAMLAIVPGNFNGMLGLALLYQKDMHYTEAMNLVNQLVELHPNNALAYAARGGMEVERGALELAEYDYSQAIKLEPENTDFLINRVDVRLKLGRKKQAREDLDQAVKMGVPLPALAEFYAKCKE